MSSLLSPKMASSSTAFLFIILTLCLSLALAHQRISYDNRAFKIDGKKKLIISGAIHYPRSTPEMWPSLIKKAKEGGLNTIETYVFWNAHEPSPRKYDFSGNLDLIKFLRVIKQEKMYAILRIGPYVCAEWNFGGLPVWLLAMGNVTAFRTQDDAFQNEMKIFTTKIVDMVQQEALFASQGGPIILAQIENEYGDISWKFESSGRNTYLNWCANLAESFDTGVPWVMCQEKDAPSPMIETCNGFYCDQFHPQNKSVPKVWTENWSGWFKKWGGQDEHRPAEDLAFSVARFFQFGGSVHNYYMYHGGTNFGRAAGGPYITTAYDYDAPINEYGMVNQPKWGHLAELHVTLKKIEKFLTEGVPRNIEYGNMMTVTEFALNGDTVCFFGNANETSDITVNYKGFKYTTPAWSVSILSDCEIELFNTARVNAQTSVLVNKPVQDHSAKLNWTWRYEFIEQFMYPGKRLTYANELREQKSVTNDISDYLWYMTSFNGPDLGPRYTLQVHSAGHGLHLFVNGVYMASKYSNHGEGFVFEHPVTLKPGKNKISLLSVTVGLPNYGAGFEKDKQGVVGPVKLLAPNKEFDLSTKLWAYKIGMDGHQRKLFDGRFDPNFSSHNLPVNRMLTWYKTNFEAPPGNDPVVLDLLGMGKGIAYVNGHDIGRYWPSNPEVDSCPENCDYRGSYRPEKKCRTCKQSSQRWYHVPRSFLKPGKNVLVLFEEIGGDVDSVSVQTVRTWKVCAVADENHALELSCDGGRKIKEIKFASRGDPKGNCGTFDEGFCGSPNTKKVVSNTCLGKETCSITLDDQRFLPSRCAPDIKMKLAVEAVCG